MANPSSTSSTDSTSMPPSSTTISGSSSTFQNPMFLLGNISNLVSIKLDSSNYILWKYQILSLLKTYSLLRFVDGSFKCPTKFLIDASGNETTEENPACYHWIMTDQALLTLLNSTLSSSALSLVVGQTAAQGVWNTLERRFTSISRSNILNLKMELHSIKKDSDSVEVYLHRIKEIRDKLASVSVDIDDEEILHIVLKGLPPEFNAFCSAIHTRSEPVLFEDLHILLHAEEISLKESLNTQKHLVNSIAMAASTSGNSRNLTRSTFQSHNKGHGRSSNNRGKGSGNRSPNTTNFSQNFSQTPRPQNNSPSFGSTSGKPVCQICDKTGHSALDCYNRMNFSYQGRHPPAKLAAMAASMQSSSTPSSNYWLSDTGATNHITSDLSNLSLSNEFTGSDVVAVGNGEGLSIAHIGSSEKVWGMWRLRTCSEGKRLPPLPWMRWISSLAIMETILFWLNSSFFTNFIAISQRLSLNQCVLLLHFHVANMIVIREPCNGCILGLYIC